MIDLRTLPLHDGDLFSRRVREYAQDGALRHLHILEAGCARGEEFVTAPVECTVTGVDVDDAASRSRVRARHGLDGWHLGDLRTIPMPPRVYDIVHAPYLVARTSHAELVLDRFVAALKPGGLLLVRFRDRDSAFGFIDRTVPRWLRGLLWPRHGREPEPPPAVYESVASRHGMRWYCVVRGLVIGEEYTVPDGVGVFRRWGGLTSVLCRAVAALSRGRLAGEHGEVVMVIRKPESRFARVIC